MKRLLTITLITIVSTFAVIAQNSKAEQELHKVNPEYDAVIVAGDVKALELIFADEFVYTTPDGEVRNKT